jgi:2-polyprenyl-3-methyl-5-hydroxy-6-metoxy-1,4-benzoquinol methylase
MVVAAGDDPFAVELAALGIRTSINDIDTEALSHLSQLAVKHRVQLDAVYGDVRDLVLDEPVDVVFIKNLLHHLVDVEDAARVLRHLQSQARRLVVVEIRDPRAELLARLWNAYYRLMLADDGCNFIGPSAFASIVRSADPKATIRTTRTIKGTYLIASLRGAHADSSLELSGRRAFLDSSDT